MNSKAYTLKLHRIQIQVKAQDNDVAPCSCQCCCRKCHNVKQQKQQKLKHICLKVTTLIFTDLGILGKFFTAACTCKDGPQNQLSTKSPKINSSFQYKVTPNQQQFSV